VAVARPQHQPVIAKSNRAVITVNGSVPYVKKSHIQMVIKSARAWAADMMQPIFFAKRLMNSQVVFNT